MDKFKLGDIVILPIGSSKWEESMANPFWGGEFGYTKGIIIELKRSGLKYRVQWDNGNPNAYDETDLELYTNTLPKVNLEDELFEL